MRWHHMESIQSSSCAVELKCKADKSKWHVKCFPKNSKSGVKRSGDNRTFFHTFPPGRSRAHHPSGLMCPVVSSLAGGRTGGTASGRGGGFTAAEGASVSLWFLFACAVAEREAVCSHHSCRAKLLLWSLGLVGTLSGSHRQVDASNV